MSVIKTTRSICPECLKVIDATIFEKNGEILIKKDCPDHGLFEDIYWSNAEEYKRVQKYAVIGEGVKNPNTKVIHSHPFDCGLCPNHKSHTALAIIDVTN